MIFGNLRLVVENYVKVPWVPIVADADGSTDSYCRFPFLEFRLSISE